MVPASSAPPARPRFFGPLPSVGVWTALGLTRAQFFAITLGSIALFVFVGGPVWAHVHDRHAARLAWSYAAIPVAVAWALRRNGSLGLGRLLAASGVIALLKLVATAGVLAMLGIGR